MASTESHQGNPQPAAATHTPHNRPKLGRGLSSLIVNSTQLADDTTYRRVTGLPPITPASESQHSQHATSEPLKYIAIDQIAPNPYQPRRDFDPTDLAELADSIAKQGLLQPLVVMVNQAADGGKPYIVIAGERRLRASRQAGLMEVPCLIRQATQQQMLEWALIENIHRADLNPVEKAEAYHQYIERFSLTQADAAERLGQPRATVANYLRILDLHSDVQSLLIDGSLSFGHAKVLAGLAGQAERQTALARRCIHQRLSVRALEELITSGADGMAVPRKRRTKPPYLMDLEGQVSRAVGARVSILPGRAKNTGKLVIEYYNLDDFDRLLACLGAKVES